MSVTVNKPRAIAPLAILVEKLENILKTAKNTENIELVAQIEEAYQFASALEPYLTEVSSQESPALTHLATKTAQEDWTRLFQEGKTPFELEQEMLSGHIEGQMLQIFVKMLNAKNVLEIGMFTGYSALAMAEALPEDGQVIACEVDEYVAKFAQDCFSHSPHGNKITVKVAPALHTMAQLAQEDKNFDLVFIDANKKEYQDYFNLLLDKNLVSSGAIIVVDNTLYQGQVYLPESERTENGEAINQFNHMVAHDERVQQVLLPLRDGLTVMRVN
ncbi:class I SAM-dependent methyltransferase [Cyanobacterium stanieri LEGE 03274]|uniref:Class I SAM-dependent methyltransferase n=1 Tax=Cyanobacterium stanieri LEGE 03274 TaxID=1828756 RepID=A0ABR9V1D2_9CHRO|nr:class I SAM-dependent methyltransferase [Cyanobacterium stanieri]MBE9221698.1 class I SAM-dependent methyltransferase [Cyanobacterium stanieri LEGE 03274]